MVVRLPGGSVNSSTGNSFEDDLRIPTGNPAVDALKNRILNAMSGIESGQNDRPERQQAKVRLPSSGALGRTTPSIPLDDKVTMYANGQTDIDPHKAADMGKLPERYLSGPYAPAPYGAKGWMIRTEAEAGTKTASLDQSSGRFKTSLGGVTLDPRLIDIIDTAAERFAGYSVKKFSGVAPRGTGTTNHPKGRAIDVEITDDATGNVIPKYTGKAMTTAQFAKSPYGQFAALARQVQQEKYPELDKKFRAGGFFQGEPNPGDDMHFDLSGGLSKDTPVQTKQWAELAALVPSAAPPSAPGDGRPVMYAMRGIDVGAQKQAEIDSAMADIAEKHGRRLVMIESPGGLGEKGRKAQIKELAARLSEQPGEVVAYSAGGYALRDAIKNGAIDPGSIENAMVIGAPGVEGQLRGVASVTYVPEINGVDHLDLVQTVASREQAPDLNDTLASNGATGNPRLPKTMARDAERDAEIAVATNQPVSPEQISAAGAQAAARQLALGGTLKPEEQFTDPAAAMAYQERVEAQDRLEADLKPFLSSGGKEDGPRLVRSASLDDGHAVMPTPRIRPETGPIADAVTSRAVSGFGGPPEARQVADILTAGRPDIGVAPLPAHIATGAVGNMMQEAYPDIRPDAKGKAGERGIGQWDKARYNDMVAWTTKNGLDPNSREGQALFYSYEMQTGYPQVMSKLEQARTPAEAARIIAKGYEKAGNPQMSKREAFATQVAGAAVPRIQPAAAAASGPAAGYPGGSPPVIGRGTGKLGAPDKWTGFLQQKLKDIDPDVFGDVDVDGVYGKQTEAAVKAFSRMTNDPKPNGRAGPHVWGEIAKASPQEGFGPYPRPRPEDVAVPAAQQELAAGVNPADTQAGTPAYYRAEKAAGMMTRFHPQQADMVRQRVEGAKPAATPRVSQGYPIQTHAARSLASDASGTSELNTGMARTSPGAFTANAFPERRAPAESAPRITPRRSPDLLMSLADQVGGNKTNASKKTDKAGAPPPRIGGDDRNMGAMGGIKVLQQILNQLGIISPESAGMPAPSTPHSIEPAVPDGDAAVPLSIVPTDPSRAAAPVQPLSAADLKSRTEAMRPWAPGFEHNQNMNWLSGLNAGSIDRDRLYSLHPPSVNVEDQREGKPSSAWRVDAPGWTTALDSLPGASFFKEAMTRAMPTVDSVPTAIRGLGGGPYPDEGNTPRLRSMAFGSGAAMTQPGAAMSDGGPVDTGAGKGSSPADGAAAASGGTPSSGSSSANEASARLAAETNNPNSIEQAIAALSRAIDSMASVNTDDAGRVLGGI